MEEQMKQKFITITLSIIVILAALLIFIDSLDYNLPKLWVLILGEIVLIILLLASYRDLKIDRKDILLFFFLALVFISTFLSSDPLKSIIGEKNRYEGLLSFIAYVCIYLAAKKFFYYEKIEEFLNILFYVSMGIGILGIFQNYISFPALIPLFNKGICSTFGNSNFFGSYISLVLPVAIVFFIFAGKKRGLLLSLILFFNLLSSGTRSAWVAFAVVAIMGIIYLIKQKDKSYFKRFGILLLGFILIYLYLYLLPTGTVFRSKSDQMKEDVHEIFSTFEKKDASIARYAGSYRIEV